MRYKDFVIQIGRDDGEGHRLRVIDSPAGQGTGYLRLSSRGRNSLSTGSSRLGTTHRGVPSPLRHLVPPTPKEVDVPREHELGEGLFDGLFSGQIRSLYDRSLGELRGEVSCGLRIKLKFDPSIPNSGQLQALPWELLRRAETQEYLSLSRLSPVVRYLDVPVPFHALPLPETLRLLVVVSSPKDLDELDVAREREQLEGLRKAGAIDVSFLDQAQPETLRRALIENEIHVLHFIGHGGFNTATGQGVLYLVGADGRSLPIGGDALATKLRDVRTLRLTVLNACESGRADAGDANPFAGVANALVLGGMPAVVAMQVPISDAAAIAFSDAFYRHLALGDPVDAALTEGRQAIHSAAPDRAEWSTPILFLRIPDSTLFRSRPTPPLNDRELPPAEPEPHTSSGWEGRRSWGFTTGLIVTLLALISIGIWSFSAGTWPWSEFEWKTEVPTINQSTLGVTPKEPDPEPADPERTAPKATDPKPTDPTPTAPRATTPSPPPPTPVPVKKEPPFPLSAPVRGKIGILVLDKSTQGTHSEVAWAIESALSAEIAGIAPMVPSVKPGTVESLLQNDYSSLPTDGRTPWGAERLLVVRSQRKKLADSANLESVSLSLSAQLIVVADQSIAKRTSDTQTGRGASTEQALVQASERCLRELTTYLKEKEDEAI